MPRWLMATIVKPVVVLFSGGIMGLVFGVVPCYLFPLFGAAVRNWCGHRSEPPHFMLQFWLGFFLAAAIAIWLLYLRKK